MVCDEGLDNAVGLAVSEVWRFKIRTELYNCIIIEIVCSIMDSLNIMYS